MESKITRREFVPIGIVFVVVSALLFGLRFGPAGWHIDYKGLLICNLILYLAFFLSFNLYLKALQNDRVQVFMRMIYGGMFLKMGICIAAALIYFILAGRSISRSVIFGSFALYLIYTFVEVKILMRLSKRQKNA
jgi:hypothetical protein